MVSLLLPLIYLAFISLGLPDALLGAAWPVLHTELNVPLSWSGYIFIIISVGTVVSSLLSDRLSRRLGAGDPAYLAGRSGDELYTLLTGDLVDPDIHDFDPTPEFWMGSMYCHLQWFFDRPFAEIFAALPLAELRKLRKERRDAAFEAAIAKCVRVFQPQTALKRLRAARQLSQSQLALVSGVKLRSIRAYEQGDLDIAKAQYDTLRALSAALSCMVEELIR